MNVAKPVPFKTEGPQPLLREIAPSQPYPVDALGPLRDAVEAAQAMTQAPIALAAQSALSVASLAVQPFANVQTLGGSAPLSLFCLSIARSGERKSATDRVLMKGLRDHERNQAALYQDAQQSWRNAQAVWKADHDKIMGEFKKKAGNRAAAQADLEALGAEPDAPLAPNLTATDPTLEGLHKLFAIGQPSLGVFSDEGGQFLGGHGMNSDNRLKTVAGLSAIWGGDAINRTRGGDGVSTLYGRRAALHLMAQPVAAAPLLSDKVANEQGFLARFLIAQPESAIGTRFGRGGGAEHRAILARFADKLTGFLAAPKPTADGNPQELDPRELPLSQQAEDLLWQYHDTLESGMAPGGEFASLTGFASKSPEQAARIGGVLTVFEDMGASAVSGEVMADAITLAQFYLMEAKRLAEMAEVSSETAKAETLRKWLLDKWPDIAGRKGRDPETVVPSDIANTGPNALRETKEAKKCLSVLGENGWLVRLPEDTAVDGVARKLAYRIVRA